MIAKRGLVHELPSTSDCDTGIVGQAEKGAVKELTADGRDWAFKHTEEQTRYTEKHKLRLDGIKSSLRFTRSLAAETTLSLAVHMHVQVHV